MPKELKPCPFCGGEVEYHQDDYGGEWVEHKIKHIYGSKDPCILTGHAVDYSAIYGITWNTRHGETK